MHTLASLRSPRIYLLVLAVTLFTIGLSLIAGSTLNGLSFVLLIGSVVLLGIPHGAVDHLVAADLFGLEATWRDQAMFYAGYLLLMAAYGALWFILPGFCLLLFLVFAVYHFGQSDLEYLGLGGVRQHVLDVSRGLLLVGLPLTAHLDTVAPIFAEIAGVNLLAWSWLTEHAAAWSALLVGQHALLFLALGRQDLAWSTLLRETLTIVVLTVLFVVSHPLVAFAVYFGFWHSLGHILELVRFFNRRGARMTLAGFYRKAALFTVISLAGLGVLYLAGGAFGLRERMLSLLFILISVLTLPHMVIVEKFWRGRYRPPA